MTSLDENQVPKKPRIKYTKQQVARLEGVFEESHYPDTDTQETLAQELNVSTERIAVWFQNRRSKFKRRRQADHVAWMRKQIFQTGSESERLLPFGTPLLPALTPGCHVLSPLDSQIPRGDAMSENSRNASFTCSPLPPQRPNLHDTPHRHSRRNPLKRSYDVMNAIPEPIPQNIATPYCFTNPHYAMLFPPSHFACSPGARTQPIDTSFEQHHHVSTTLPSPLNVEKNAVPKRTPFSILDHNAHLQAQQTACSTYSETNAKPSTHHRYLQANLSTNTQRNRHPITGGTFMTSHNRDTSPANQISSIHARDQSDFKLAPVGTVNELQAAVDNESPTKDCLAFWF